MGVQAVVQANGQSKEVSQISTARNSATVVCTLQRLFCTRRRSADIFYYKYYFTKDGSKISTQVQETICKVRANGKIFLCACSIRQ